MTATTVKDEVPMLFVTLLDGNDQLYGITLQLPTHEWRGIHEWPVAELGTCGEVAGATLHYEGLPLEVCMVLPPELSNEHGRTVGATLLEGIKLGYRRAEDAADQ